MKLARHWTLCRVTISTSLMPYSAIQHTCMEDECIRISIIVTYRTIYNSIFMHHMSTAIAPFDVLP